MVASSRHGPIEDICGRGCDDLPFGEGTLPLIAIEDEAPDELIRIGNILKEGGYLDDKAALS